MPRWPDLPASGRMLTFRRAAILSASIVLLRLALLAVIKDRERLLPIDDALLTLASGLAAIGMIYAAFHSEGKSRNAWLLFAIAQTAYTLGEAAWTVIEVVQHQNPFLSVADIGYFVFYPVFILSILILPTVPLSSREQLKILLDIGIAVSAFTLIFWSIIIAPIIASNEALTLKLAVSVAYPIMDVLLFVALLELIFRKLSSAGTISFFVLAVGLVMLLITDVMFSLQTQQGTYISGGLLDTGWLISYMIFWLAGIAQANSIPFNGLAGFCAIYDRRSAWAQYISFLGIGATFSFLDWGYQNSPFIDKSVISVSICIIFLLMFIRQKVTLDESNQLLVLTQSAIEERNQADEALQESEDRYHSVMEQASDIICLYDLETMRLLEGNLAFQKLLGYSKDEISGLSIYDIMMLDRESIDKTMEKIKEKKQYFVGPGKYRKKDGSVLDVEAAINLISYRGRIVFSAVARDLTERNKAEYALHRSEKEKAAIIDGLKNVFVEYLNPQMQIIWSNEAFQKQPSLSEDESEGKRCFEFRRGLEMPCPGCTALKALQTSQPQEGELITPDGKVWISKSNLIKDAHGEVSGVVHVAIDISDRKMAEKALSESENRYRAIFENTGTATVIVEDNTIISLANSEFERLSGYSKEEIEGKISWTEFVIKDDLEMMLEQHKLRRIDPNAALRSYEFRARNRGGQIRDILLHIDIIPGTKKSIASWTEITERKHSEEMLRASLAEKELLLKEIHHRVKNNLQVISALLYLQSSNITDENTTKIFKDSQNRIKSMALIHENLYRSESLGKVNFNEYIGQLISHLSQSYGDLSSKISFRINSNNVYLNINTAIPCGMIINELVSNSLKHAFPDGKSGEICIDLSSEDDGYRLIMSDNGSGIKGDLNIRDSKTLGFRLIDTLVKQIDGKISFDTTIGTKCEIHFKGLK